MSQPFKVSVNETYEFSFSEEDLQSLNAVQTSSSEYHVLKNGRPFVVEVVSQSFFDRTYLVKVKNETYEVVLKNEIDQLIAKMGFSLGSAKNIRTILAPMPGLILDIQVKEGDTVAEDSPLLILEAMKMENVIMSPREGTIKKISVKKGETVDKKQLLISFE
ncbi:acetyl-CoA carboxylase biotin carboxyl carrier protein subunit [Muriicola sp.]|uniref:acetyl-CoA carboxylase biotin carboxyl carrier protein subunit n=1 Tax=Muriicola sp. TaxID=2020856 RepID=UPI003C74A22E